MKKNIQLRVKKHTLFILLALTPLIFIFAMGHRFFNSFAAEISHEQENGKYQHSIFNAEGTTVSRRFSPPPGYERMAMPEQSFGYYLQHFPLLPHGTDVLFFNGKKKPKDVHAAVLDIDVGTKDLQQCADAIMRLYAEHLFEKKQFDEIGFHFTNGFYCDYVSWRNGKRIQVDGNKTKWVQRSSYSDTWETFRSYMEFVFIYAGTISMSKELTAVDYKHLEPGHVFVQGGSPGHAVVVVDCAVNDRGEKMYLLAQSYMPAQSIHVLKNLNDPEISPWYKLNENETIYTPEWTFYPHDLKRFPVIRKK
jgi:hypothetical protein